MKSVFVVFLAIWAVEARSIDGGQCRVSIDYLKGDLKEPQPLILTDSPTPRFVLPSEKRLLVLAANESLLLACPGRNNSLDQFEEKQWISARCLSGKEFAVGSSVHEFSSFRCKVLPKETIKKSSKCLEVHQEYEVGFQVGPRFVGLLRICRDESSLRTYYTRARIAKEIDSYQSSYPRPYWRYGSYYRGYNMNQIYKAQSQLQSVGLQLGSEQLAAEYVRPGEQYLHRGHLAAKADFVYGAQQTATFWLLNTAPQWASFNSGNWVSLEMDVRRWAAELLGRDLVVYTGVHGLSSLRDAAGEERPLYLHANSTGRAFPVPRFFWKVVHEPLSNRAIAFVGLNQPYAEAISKDMYLCPDLSDEPGLSWLSWQPDDIERGVSYVCSVEELRKAVPTVPHLGELGLLL